MRSLTLLMTLLFVITGLNCCDGVVRRAVRTVSRRRSTSSGAGTTRDDDEIDCYQCTSQQHSGCGFNTTLTKTDSIECEDVFKCYTKVELINGVTHYTRGCEVTSLPSGCHNITSIYNTTQEVCYCDDDLCNGKATLTNIIGLILSSLFLSLFISLWK